MKAAAPSWKLSREVSSSEVVIAGSATGDRDSRPMIASASSVGPCSSTTAVPSSFRIDVPADSISVFAHTVSPS